MPTGRPPRSRRCSSNSTGGWRVASGRTIQPSLTATPNTILASWRSIHGELQKLGIDVSQATVAKYVGRRNGPPSQSWRTFLTNHVSQFASIDFFTFATATFRVLFVFVVLSHDRRRIVYLNVTAHPTAAWTAQQLREAWPWDTAPPFLVRDRDGIYGSTFRRVARAMDIDE